MNQPKVVEELRSARDFGLGYELGVNGDIPSEKVSLEYEAGYVAGAKERKRRDARPKRVRITSKTSSGS